MTNAGGASSDPNKSIWGPLGRDFGIRLASALVLFGIALVVVWLGGWPFAAWVAAACALMAFEWERMTQHPVDPVGVVIPAIAILIAAALGVLALYLPAFGVLVWAQSRLWSTRRRRGVTAAGRSHCRFILASRRLR